MFGVELSENHFRCTVKEEQHGIRLDRILTDIIPDLSRSRVKALIEDGYATLDGEVVKDPNHRVRTGDTLLLSPPLPKPDYPIPQEIPLDIQYEDDHLIVLNKPSGLVVHPGAGNADGTLVNALLAHCGESLSGIGGVKRPGIVHRIDKDTSGLLVIAKTERAHHSLSEQFSSHTIKRRYDALVWGVPSPLSGTVENSIGRSTRNRKKMSVIAVGGKIAITHYKVMRTFGHLVSHVSCELETGRTHQIRVHMTSLGHSLLGDQVYGRDAKRGTPPNIVEAIKVLGRQALHAAVLGFEHPETHEKLTFEATLPNDFTILVSKLDAIQTDKKER